VIWWAQSGSACVWQRIFALLSKKTQIGFHDDECELCAQTVEIHCELPIFP
jgi:hypothetical protein